MIARSTGAARAQRGSSDGWTLRSGAALAAGSSRSPRKAHTTTASGRAAEIRARASSGVDAVGLVTRARASARQPPPARRQLAARRPGGRAGDDQRRGLRRRRQPLSTARRTRGCEEDGRQAARRSREGPDGLLALGRATCGRGQARRRVVHLVWMTRALQPARLDLDRLAVLVLRADADVQRALDVDQDAGSDRQPSSIVSCSLAFHSMTGLMSALTGLSGCTR